MVKGTDEKYTVYNVHTKEIIVENFNFDEIYDFVMSIYLGHTNLPKHYQADKTT